MNEIISWGPIIQEFKDFHHLDFIHIGNDFEKINLQFIVKIIIMKIILKFGITIKFIF